MTSAPLAPPTRASRRAVTGHHSGRALGLPGGGGGCVLTLTTGAGASDIDGSTLVAGDNHRRVRLWDVATGHPALSLHIKDVHLCSGEYSADGRRVVTVKEGAP